MGLVKWLEQFWPIITHLSLQMSSFYSHSVKQSEEAAVMIIHCQSCFITAIITRTEVVAVWQGACGHLGMWSMVVCSHTKQTIQSHYTTQVYLWSKNCIKHVMYMSNIVLIKDNLVCNY